MEPLSGDSLWKPVFDERGGGLGTQGLGPGRGHRVQQPQDSGWLLVLPC